MKHETLVGLAAALAMTGPVPCAAQGFELLSTHGELSSQAHVFPGALAQQHQLISDPALLPVSGVPLVQTNHLAWVLEDEPPPLGSGQRSTGAIDADLQMAFTLIKPGPDQFTITSSGLATSSASYLVQAANGDFVFDGGGLQNLFGDLRLEFRLNHPAELRLAGHLWTTTPGAEAMFRLLRQSGGGAPAPVEVGAASGGEATDLLAQTTLMPGTYAVSATLVDIHTLQCCTQSYGGSMGWDYTLELGALPVAEPATPALLLAGLGVVALRRLGRQRRVERPQAC